MFLLVTGLVAGVGIFILASLIQWIVTKAAPGPVASFGRVGTTLAVVAFTTLAVVFVMTRPAVVGPYEQWTFQNIGGQVLGGLLAAGVMLWLGAPEAPEEAAVADPSVADPSVDAPSVDAPTGS